MAVNVVRLEHMGEPRWGRVRNGLLIPIPGEFPTTGAFVAGNSAQELARLTGGGLEPSAVKILSPVTRNQQFVCQGANYRQHMIESGMDPDAKTFNMIFTKASSCVVPADSPVVRPRHVRFLDYEIELGLVVRRDITHKVVVTEANLHECVAGLVMVNDYSARDIQIPQLQFYKGKSYRTFGPVGPYLCLLEPDEFSLLKQLRLELTVNGEPRQSDSAANLVFGPAETLTELSGIQDLFAGDLIATGTPSGCALTIPSPPKQRIAALLPETIKWNMFMRLQAGRPYLKIGDKVESRIATPDGRLDLGVQRNLVVEEPV